MNSNWFFDSCTSGKRGSGSPEIPQCVEFIIFSYDLVKQEKDFMSPTCVLCFLFDILSTAHMQPFSSGCIVFVSDIPCVPHVGGLSSSWIVLHSFFIFVC